MSSSLKATEIIAQRESLGNVLATHRLAEGEQQILIKTVRRRQRRKFYRTHTQRFSLGYYIGRFQRRKPRIGKSA